MNDIELTELLVSLDVVSERAQLSEISSAMGMECTKSCSHDLGEPLAGRPNRKWPHTIWRLTSARPEKAPICEHLDDLFIRFPFDRIRGGKLPSDAEILLNIGVVGIMFCRTLEIPGSYLKVLAEHSITLTVAVYHPVEDSDSASSEPGVY